MKALGKVTFLAGLVGCGFATVLIIRSIPDIKRYLKIRAM